MARATVQFLAQLLAVAAIHVVVVQLLPSWPRYVDLFVVLAIFVALRGNTVAALLAGTVVGVAQDALIGGRFGLHGFATTLTAYAVARLSQQLAVQQRAVVFLIYLLATLLHQGILALLLLWLFADSHLPTPWQLMIKSVVAAVLGLVALTAAGRLGRRREVRSQQRRSKPRLG